MRKSHVVVVMESTEASAETLLNPQHSSMSSFVISEDLWALFYLASSTLKL